MIFGHSVFVRNMDDLIYNYRMPYYIFSDSQVTPHSTFYPSHLPYTPEQKISKYLIILISNFFDFQLDYQFIHSRKRPNFSRNDFKSTVQSLVHYSFPFLESSMLLQCWDGKMHLNPFQLRNASSRQVNKQPANNVE